MTPELLKELRELTVRFAGPVPAWQIQQRDDALLRAAKSYLSELLDAAEERGRLLKSQEILAALAQKLAVENVELQAERDQLAADEKIGEQLGRQALDMLDKNVKLRAENDRLSEQLACCCDLVNSWCRESSTREVGDPYCNLNLRTAVDGLWSRLSGAMFELNRRLVAQEAENAELKRRLAELTEDDGR